MSQEVLKSIDFTYTLIDIYGTDIESKFNDDFTPYQALLKHIPEYKSYTVVDRIKMAIAVWCNLIERSVVDITEQIEADFTYHVELDGKGNRIGFLIDNLSDDLCYLINVDELLAGNVIDGVYDLDNLKLVFKSKGVIDDHHTLVRRLD